MKKKGFLDLPTEAWVGSILIIIVLIFLTLESIKQLMSNEMINNLRHFLLLFASITGVHLIDRAFLQKKTETLIMRSAKEAVKDSMTILQRSAECGLTMVYPNRKKAKDEILEAINNVNHKLQILGIVFSEVISFNEILLAVQKREAELNRKIEIQILLMDVLRSPAVFRAFIENKPEQANRLFEYNRESSENINDPYFGFDMYTRFIKVSDNLNSTLHKDRYQDHVRFYGLNPSCWMIRVDNIIFFEPYTHGRSTDDDNHFQTQPWIGPLMPVFKFQNDQGADTFRILENHFDKMWLTSNEDLFHIEARKEDKVFKMREIFRKRKIWLKHVYGALYYKDKATGHIKHRKKDERKSPRFCEEGSDLIAKIVCGAMIYQCVIKNYSREGIGLSFCTSAESAALKVDDQIKLDIGSINTFPLSAQYALNRLNISDNSFVVKWNENGCIGLQVKSSSQQ